MNPFDTLLIIPLTNVVVAIYQALLVIHIPYPLGFSIIFLTILIRLLLYPLITAQLHASRKMQEMSPHIARVKEKHKGDSARVQQETMKLYKEHGVNPAAGCLPVIVQLPVIWALYAVLQKIVSLSGDKVVMEINKVIYPIDGLRLTAPWDQNFFGIPLGLSPTQLMSTYGPIVVGVSLFTALFQFAQSKMMYVKIKEEVGKQEKKKDDFASMMQTQSLYIFPAMIGIFSFTLPIGLSLYWNTFTIFGILQQYRVQGWGGLSDWIDKVKPSSQKSSK